MFSIFAQNRRRGWQNFEKKTGDALAKRVLRNFVTLGADFESQNWKHDHARLCFILYIPSWLKFWEKFENFRIFWKILENFGKFWKISNCNFQSRRQIMKARGVYYSKTLLHCLLPHAFFLNFVFNSQGLWRALGKLSKTF